jgi:hypothetical protein
MRDNNNITYFENNNALRHFHIQLWAFLMAANEHRYDDCHIWLRSSLLGLFAALTGKDFFDY